MGCVCVCARAHSGSRPPVQIPAPQFTSCVTLGKLLNLLVSQFPSVKEGKKQYLSNMIDNMGNALRTASII